MEPGSIVGAGLLLLGLGVLLTALYASSVWMSGTPVSVYMIQPKLSSPVSAATADRTATTPTDVLAPFDAVLYINLDHRVDRRQQIEAELQRFHVPPTKIHRVPGVVAPSGRGALGCTQAHIRALRTFLDHPEWQTCVILEDDFEFIRDPLIVSQKITTFLQTVQQEWDVLVLSGNIESIVQPSEPYKGCGAHRLLKSRNTDAYIVNRTYAPTLLANFEDGFAKLQKQWKRRYRLDVYWQRLQPQDRWYVFKPLLGDQRQSYSDIDRKGKNQPLSPENSRSKS